MRNPARSAPRASQKLLETCRGLHRRNIELTETTRLLEEKVKSLTASREVLRRNFSSLLLTAKAEIERKDARLKELQTSLDESSIRGNRRGANSSHLEAVIERRARELADRWQQRQRSESPEPDGTRRPRHQSLPDKGRQSLSDKRRKKRRGIADVVASLDKNNATVCVANSSISLTMDQIPWERRKTITFDQSLLSPRKNDQSQVAARADDQSHMASGADDQSVHVVKVVDQSKRNIGRDGRPGKLRKAKNVRISDASGERVLEAATRQPGSSREPEAQTAKNVPVSSRNVSDKCDSPSRVSECSKMPAGDSLLPELRNGEYGRGNVTESAPGCDRADKNHGITDKDDDVVGVNDRSGESGVVSKRCESVGKAPEKSAEIQKASNSLEKCKKMNSPSTTSRSEIETCKSELSRAISSNKDLGRTEVASRHADKPSRRADGAIGGGKSSVQPEDSAGVSRRKAGQSPQPRAASKKDERCDVTPEDAAHAGDTAATCALSKTKVKRVSKSADGLDNQKNTLPSAAVAKKAERPPQGHCGEEADSDSDSSMYITNWEEESPSVSAAKNVPATKIGNENVPTMNLRKDGTLPPADSNNRGHELRTDRDEEHHIFSPPAQPVDTSSNSGGKKVRKRGRRSRVALADSDSSVMYVAQESDAEQVSTSPAGAGTSARPDPSPGTASETPSEMAKSDDVSNQNSSKSAEKRVTANSEERKQQSANRILGNDDGSETSKRRVSEAASSDEVIIDVEFCLETPAGCGESLVIKHEKDVEQQKGLDSALHKPSDTGEEADGIAVPRDPSMIASSVAGSRDMTLLQEGTQDKSLRNVTVPDELERENEAEKPKDSSDGEIETGSASKSKDVRRPSLERQLTSMFDTDSADSDVDMGICAAANAASAAARCETRSGPVSTCAEEEEVAGGRLLARSNMEVDSRPAEVNSIEVPVIDDNTRVAQRTEAPGSVSGEASSCPGGRPKSSRSPRVDQRKPSSSRRISKPYDDVRNREEAAAVTTATPDDITIPDARGPRQSQYETHSSDPASPYIARPLQRGKTTDHKTGAGPNVLSKASPLKDASEKMVPDSGKLTTALQIPGAELSALTTPAVSAKSTKRGKTCLNGSGSTWRKSSSKADASSKMSWEDERLARKPCAETSSLLSTKIAEQGKAEKSLPQAGKFQSLETAPTIEGAGQTDVNAVLSTCPVSSGQHFSIGNKVVESDALKGKSPGQDGNECLKRSSPKKEGLSSLEERPADDGKASPAESEHLRHQGSEASPPREQNKEEEEEGSDGEESPCKSMTLTSSSPRSESSSEDSSSDDESSSEELDSSDLGADSDSDKNSEASEDDKECTDRCSDDDATLTNPEGTKRSVYADGKRRRPSHNDTRTDVKSGSDLPQGNSQDSKSIARTCMSQCSPHDRKNEQMAVKARAKQTERHLNQSADMKPAASNSPPNNDGICQTKSLHASTPHEDLNSMAVLLEDETPQKNGENAEDKHASSTGSPPGKQLTLSRNNVAQEAPVPQLETLLTEDSESDYHLNVDLDEDDLDYEPETPVKATIEAEEVPTKTCEDQPDPTSVVNSNCLQPSVPQRGSPGKGNVELSTDAANDGPLDAPTAEKSKHDHLNNGDRSGLTGELDKASAAENKQGTENKDEDDEWEEGEIIDDSSPSPKSHLDSGSQHSQGSVRSTGSGRRVPLTTVARGLQSFNKWLGNSQKELWSEVFTGWESGFRIPRKRSLDGKEDTQESPSAGKRRISHEKPPAKLISGRSPSKLRRNPRISPTKPGPSARYRSPTKLTRTKVSPRGKLSHRSPLKRNDFRGKLARRLSHLDGASEAALSQDRREARARVSGKNRPSPSQTPPCAAGPSRESLPLPGGGTPGSTSREPGNPNRHRLLRQPRESVSSPDRSQVFRPTGRLLESRNKPELSGSSRRSPSSQEDGELPSRPGNSEVRGYASRENDVRRRRASQDIDGGSDRRLSRESDRDEDTDRYQRHRAERVVEQDERRAIRPELGHSDRVRQRHEDSRSVLRDRRLSENNTSPCRKRPSPREERSSSREKRSWSRVQPGGTSDRFGTDRGRYSDIRPEVFRDRREERRQRPGAPRFGPNRRSDENDAYHWRRSRERSEEREGKPEGKCDGRARKRSHEWSQDRESQDEDHGDGKRKRLSLQRDDEHGGRLSDSRRLNPKSARMRDISEEREQICFETPKKSSASDRLSEDGRNLGRYLDAFINQTPYHEESMSLFAPAVERRALSSKKADGGEREASSSILEFPKLRNGKGGAKDSKDDQRPTQKPQLGFPTLDKSKLRSKNVKDPDTVRRTSGISSKTPDEQLPESQVINVSERASSNVSHSTAQRTSVSPSRANLEPSPQNYDNVSPSFAPDMSRPERAVHPISSGLSLSQSAPDSLSQSRSLSRTPRFKQRRRRGAVRLGDSGTDLVMTTSPEAPASAPRQHMLMLASGDDVNTTQRGGDVGNTSVTSGDVPTNCGTTVAVSQKEESSAIAKDLRGRLSPVTMENGKQPAGDARSDSSPDTLEALARRAERLREPVVLTNEDSEASLLTYFRSHKS